MELPNNSNKIHVALFFGSFNPIHIGHLQIGSQILKNFLCHNIWYIVSPINPLKESSPVDFFNRVHMASLSTKDWNEPRFTVSTIESSLTPHFYTQKTLEHIKTLHPEINFSVVIGEDNLLILEKWYKPQWIIQNFPILVYRRDPTSNLRKNSEIFSFLQINWIPGEKITTSSKKIREEFYKKNTILTSTLVTRSVFDFITDTKIYESVKT